MFSPLLPATLAEPLAIQPAVSVALFSRHPILGGQHVPVRSELLTLSRTAAAHTAATAMAFLLARL